MAGVGKLLKQAQKMQKKMQEVQDELASSQLEVSAGGGAIKISITGSGEIKSVKFDPEFLKEDVSMIEDTLLLAIKDAQEQSKKENEEKMQGVTAGMGLPGFF